MYFMEYDSPVGKLLLRSSGEALTGLWIGGEPEGALLEDDVICRAKVWLDAYFRGEERTVDFPIAPEGTVFQKQVWQSLRSVGWGETRTYGDLAREMAIRTGKETMSAQAVGQAVGKNPISIIIPCHRIIGTKGQLTGYAWGIEKKKWLLEHEAGRKERE